MARRYANRRSYKQNIQSVCVFKGKGTVLEIKDIVIDYDSWGDDDQKIGKVPYRNCLVKCITGIGWAGEGALVKATKQ